MTKGIKRVSLVLAAALALAWAGPVAAVMQTLTVNDLTAASEVVAVGRVTDKVSHFSADGKRIETTVTVRVEEVVKGETTSSTVTIRHPGGEVGELGMKVSDMPAFTAGEKVVVFVKSAADDDSGVFSMTGKAQGKYTVTAEGRAKKGAYTAAVQGADNETDLPLTSLLNKVKAAAGK